MSYQQLIKAHFDMKQPIDLCEEWEYYFKGETPNIWKACGDIIKAGLGVIILNNYLLCQKKQKEQFVPGGNNKHTAGRKVDPYDRAYRG